MKNLLISFSGGRTSALMTKILITSPKFKDYNILTVYANTGKEKEETLKFINQCDKEFNLDLIWIEADVNFTKGKGTDFKIVNFESASRNGEPFEDVIKKFGLPSKVFRHCTRELKEIPIHKFAKKYFRTKEYLTAIGIRADEKHRVGEDPLKFYPLVDLNVNENFVRRFWDQQSFDLQIKDYEGNCDLCFLKSVRKKMTLIKEDKQISDWWDNMENKYGGHSPKGFDPLRLRFDEHRNLSIPDLVEMAQKTFHLIRDKHELNKPQTSLFDIDIDSEFDCFCKMN